MDCVDLVGPAEIFLRHMSDILKIEDFCDFSVCLAYGPVGDVGNTSWMGFDDVLNRSYWFEGSDGGF